MPARLALSTSSVLFQLLPKFLMDYCAGWGNRTNRDGTAPPVLNIHLWGRKTVRAASSPRPRVAHTLRLEAVKKSTASRRGAKAHRIASSNSFNFFAGLCGFAPLREIFWLGAHVFTPSLCNVCNTLC